MERGRLRLAQAETPVEAADAVVARAVLAAGIEGAQEGVILERVLVAGDHEVRVKIDDTGFVGNTVFGVDRGHRIARRDLAGQLEPERRIDDRPGIDKGLERGLLDRAAELPQVAALEEERPFLLVIK